MGIRIGDIDIEVIKKDIKNIHLAVYPPDGRVRLAAPKDVSSETIRIFATSKLAWIRKQQRKFSRQDRQSKRQYLSRESHYFLGKKYLLRITEMEGNPKVSIKNKSFLDLHVRPGTSPEMRETQLNDWYRVQLKKLLPAIIQKWEKVIGVSCSSWTVRSMRTKWGSCKPETGRILLNLELAKKPVQCIEYIVVHELIHLLERKHNDIFLAQMEKHLPQWKKLKQELNNLPVSHFDWGY